MNTKPFLLFFFICLLTLFSCKQCPRKKTLTEYGYLDEMVKYFGMYQQDNWWFYENNKHTKADSIFITDYSETIVRDNQIDCITYPTRYFNLNTIYIEDNFKGKISGVFSNNANCCINFFVCAIGAEMNSNSNSHPESTVSPAEVLIDSVTINGNTYQNSILFQHDNNKLLFAPNIGIVRFINSTDTFNLVKYYIK